MKLKYVKDKKELGKDKEGNIIYDVIYSSTEIETSFVRRYHNCLYLLLQLTKGERALMDFLTEEMDSDNIVYNNELVRTKFTELYNKVNPENKFKQDSVRLWFQRLSNKNLIIPKVKGMYQVNPMYFFKGKDEERINNIKLMLEFENNKDNKVTTNITYK